MYGLTMKIASGCEAETNRLIFSGDHSRHALREAALSRLHFFLLLRWGGGFSGFDGFSSGRRFGRFGEFWMDLRIFGHLT